MYSRILVPLDGSPTAEQVLPYVRLLAKGLQAPVELFRAVEYLPPEWMDWLVGAQPLEIAANMSRQAQEYLNGVAALLEEESMGVSATIRGGAPAPSIVEVAEKQPETLLAMCTHGRTGITRWVLGSVVSKVLRATSCPILVVRAREEETAEATPLLQTAIVPLDGSSLAEQVLPHVVALARALDLGVILTRVSLPVEDYYRGMQYPVASSGDLSLEIDTMTRRYFSQVQGKLREQGITRVRVEMLHGHPADAIIKFAKRIPHNVVTMTTHGRSGVGRWALGSVTERIVQECGDPVLVVRARE